MNFIMVCNSRCSVSKANDMIQRHNLPNTKHTSLSNFSTKQFAANKFSVEKINRLGSFH